MNNTEYLRLKEIIERTFKMEFVSDDQRKAVFASIASGGENKPKSGDNKNHTSAFGGIDIKDNVSNPRARLETIEIYEKISNRYPNTILKDRALSIANGRSDYYRGGEDILKVIADNSRTIRPGERISRFNTKKYNEAVRYVNNLFDNSSFGRPQGWTGREQIND